MMIPDSPGARLVRAKAYPFGHPKDSYLFCAGDAESLVDLTVEIRGRVPVLASGSNAAPAQLARKYSANGAGARIPVTRARLKDFDSVYNAHIAAYGSIPATLYPSPGTQLTTFITWLDEAQLSIMHATEQPGVNYHFAELSNITVTVDDLGPLDSAFAYISVVGCLIFEGTPVALAEVPAEDRRFPARSQEEMLALVRDCCAPDMALDPFILETVADADLRATRSAQLAANTQPFSYPGFRVIELT
ncbi:MAG: hypothetical protein ACI82H_000840 [Alphaproteobacteria bacterium]|jgi:hypothetical protein